MESISEHRDFVWECDYGERKPVFAALTILLDEQNEFELGMCSLFANNNPYMFEFFVVLGYESPTDSQVTEMKKLMSEAGARMRTDITFSRLIELTLRRRFNSSEVPDRASLEKALSTRQPFLFPERSHFEALFGTEPVGNTTPVFLSYATPDKPLVEDIIPYLTRAGAAIWYDRISIDYGQSIVKAMQDGIKKSGAVVFFISRSFLKSRWCEEEMESFLTENASGRDILILSLVYPDIPHEDLPLYYANKEIFTISRKSYCVQHRRGNQPNSKKEVQSPVTQLHR